ncbi:hypothetical protein BJ508DRAFT_303185 [Ascobolus immersus RN42]|uniref:Uncharacterized protein n=1 Tax=Ascobolus immersus RN42 TaxID=1160509 RepID=A0A3N4IKC8_ASCIM|nr:hypothetical protein BJ508DRAFT_303185 [Ascobolus immersus RN42]
MPAKSGPLSKPLGRDCAYGIGCNIDRDFRAPELPKEENWRHAKITTPIRIEADEQDDKGMVLVGFKDFGRCIYSQYPVCTIHTEDPESEVGRAVEFGEEHKWGVYFDGPFSFSDENVNYDAPLLDRVEVMGGAHLYHLPCYLRSRYELAVDMEAGKEIAADLALKAFSHMCRDNRLWNLFDEDAEAILELDFVKELSGEEGVEMESIFVAHDKAQDRWNL